MELLIKRFEFGEDYTVGRLLIDGNLPTPGIYTLEPRFREIKNCPVASWKVPGKTAIPRGTYPVKISHSLRFERDLPHIMEVVGFDFVEIHPGNDDTNTHGCILPGLTHRPNTDWVGNSRDAFDLLFGKIEDAINAGKSVTIEVT